MKKIEWYGKVNKSEALISKIEALLKERQNTVPGWVMSTDEIIIPEWERDWKASPFELRFDVAYSKGLVYQEEGEREVDRFETIRLLLNLINQHTPQLQLYPKLDFNTGFHITES